MHAAMQNARQATANHASPFITLSSPSYAMSCITGVYLTPSRQPNPPANNGDMAYRQNTRHFAGLAGTRRAHSPAHSTSVADALVVDRLTDRPQTPYAPQPQQAAPAMLPATPFDPSARTRTTSSANFMGSLAQQRRNNDVGRVAGLSTLAPSNDPIVNRNRAGMIASAKDRVQGQPSAPGMTAAAAPTEKTNIADQGKAYYDLTLGGMSPEEANTKVFGQQTPAQPTTQPGLQPPGYQYPQPQNNMPGMSEQIARQMFSVIQQQNQGAPLQSLFAPFSQKMAEYGVDPQTAKDLWDKFADSDPQTQYPRPGTGSPGGYPAGTPMVRPVPGAPGMMELQQGGMARLGPNGQQQGPMIPGQPTQGSQIGFRPNPGAYQPPTPPEMGPQQGYTPVEQIYVNPQTGQKIKRAGDGWMPVQ